MKRGKFSLGFHLGEHSYRLTESMAKKRQSLCCGKADEVASNILP